MIVGPNYLKVLLCGHEGFKNLPTLKFCGNITATEKDNINQVTKICTAVQHCESIWMDEFMLISKLPANAVKNRVPIG